MAHQLSGIWILKNSRCALSTPDCIITASHFTLDVKVMYIKNWGGVGGMPQIEFVMKADFYPDSNHCLAPKRVISRTTRG